MSEETKEVQIPAEPPKEIDVDPSKADIAHANREVERVQEQMREDRRRNPNNVNPPTTTRTDPKHGTLPPLVPARKS